MIDSLTLQQLRETAAHMKAHAIPHGVVRSKAEAEWLTANDPAGRVWSVGETYYTLEVKR